MELLPGVPTLCPSGKPTASKQIKLAHWLDTTTLPDGKDEQLAWLKAATLHLGVFPGRLAASRMAARWLNFINPLDETARFTAAFWFHEQVSSTTNGLTALYCFASIYPHHPSSMGSVAKEVYKKIISLTSLSEIHVECLWRLSGAFGSISPEEAKAWCTNIVKSDPSISVHACRALTAVIRLCSGPLESRFRRHLLTKLIQVERKDDPLCRLVGAILANGTLESPDQLVVSLVKAFRRFPSAADLFTRGLQHILPKLQPEFILDLLKTLCSQPTLKEEHLEMASLFIIAQLTTEFYTQLLSLDAPAVYRAMANTTGVKLPIEAISQAAQRHATSEHAHHLATILRRSINPQNPNQLTYLFAQAKTACLLHAEHFEAHLLLLDAALEAIKPDDLYVPFGLVQQIHEWAQSINCTALLPSILRLNPNLYTGEILESLELAERIDVLSALKPTNNQIFEYEGLEFVHLERLAGLWASYNVTAEQALNLVFYALTKSEDECDNLVQLFSNNLQQSPSVLLSRLAMLAPRKDTFFLRLLVALLKTLSSNGDSSDRVFCLEAAQDLLLPYYHLPSQFTLLVEALQALCSFGGQAFRSALTSSLYKQVLDYSLPTGLRTTYIRLLPVLSMEQMGTLGLLRSLAASTNALQPVAIEALSSLVMSQPHQLPPSFHSELSNLLLSLLGSSNPATTLLLALAEALGVDLADDSNPSAQLLSLACTFLLEQGQSDDDLISCCTRILLLRKSFPSTSLLLRRLSKRLLDGFSLDCLRWLLQFVPSCHKEAASLLPVLLTHDSPISEGLILQLLNEDISVLFEADTKPPLLPRLVSGLPSSLGTKHLQDLATRGFQRSMELLSSPSYGKEGLELLSALIERLHPARDSTNDLLLSSFQPHIITAFGLACNHENLLLRASGYLALCKLCSCDFYGLGIAEHPRLDRLLSSAATLLSEDEYACDEPELVCFYARCKLAAAWSYILAHPRLGTRFPLASPKRFVTDATKVMEAYNPEVAEYKVFTSTLQIGYALAVRCAISLLLFNQTLTDNMVRIALNGHTSDSLKILKQAEIGSSDLRSYLASYPQLTIDFIDLAFPICPALVISKCTGLHEESLLEHLLSTFAPSPQYDQIVLSMLSEQIGEPVRCQLLYLKTILPHLDATRLEIYTRLYLNWTRSGDLQCTTVIQLISFLVTFHPPGLELSASLLKTVSQLLLERVSEPGVADCAILIICKATDLTLRRLVAHQVLPTLDLSETKRALISAALADIL